MCSTFKWIAGAAVLARVERGEERLDRFVRYGEQDLLEYAPVTRQRVSEGGMRLGNLCAAAIQVSDNTAANLLLRVIGGPEAVTRFCRAHGDSVTRLDRTEPELNVVPPGDERDTTSPRAMAGLLRTVLATDAMSAQSRQQLEEWLVAATVGAQRIPAGLPKGWRVGHKTGTGPGGATNDVAIVRAPEHEPLFVAAYYSGSNEPLALREQVLAEVGRVTASGKFEAPR